MGSAAVLPRASDPKIDNRIASRLKRMSAGTYLLKTEELRRGTASGGRILEKR